jgi:hypothetical protein
LGNQIIEPAIQGYIGDYVLPADTRSTDVKAIKNFEFKDERVAGSFILYPKPFGIQAEYNWGRGPQYNPLNDSIEIRNLKGGYITASCFIKEKKIWYFIPIRAYSNTMGAKSTSWMQEDTM